MFRAKQGFAPEIQRLARLLANGQASWPTRTEEISELFELAAMHRVEGLLELRAHAAGVTLPKDDAVELLGRALRTEHRQSKIDEALASLLRNLNSLEVDVMVLKGWVSSQTVYERRYDRPFVDVDLWVSPYSPQTIGQVSSMLGANSTPSPMAIDEILEAGLLHNFAIQVSSTSFELHKNPYGLKSDPPSPSRTWSEHAVRAQHSDESVYIPTAELALATACVNYTRDCFTHLYQLVDILLLSQTPTLDWESFWTLCDNQGISSFATGALSLCARLFNIPAMPGLSSPRGWRGWWSQDHRVLGVAPNGGARLPAGLLMPGGLRTSLATAVRWAAPRSSYFDVVGRVYGCDPREPYLTNLTTLNKNRFKQARSRYW